MDKFSTFILCLPVVPSLLLTLVMNVFADNSFESSCHMPKYIPLISVLSGKVSKYISKCEEKINLYDTHVMVLQSLTSMTLTC